MSYGTIKVDTITFTDNSVDKSVSLSGLIQNPTFTGNITVTGTISGDVIRGGTTVSGATVTGTTANFVSGVFTTQISGATVTGTTASFTSGVFTNISGTTATITSGIIASGTAAAPSLAILADLDTGLFSPGANELAVATNGTGRVFVNASGNVGVGTSSPAKLLHVQSGSVSGAARGGASAKTLFESSDATATYWELQAASTATNDFLFSKGNTGSYGIVGYDHVNDALRFFANSAERLRIDSSGRLLVGTSTNIDANSKLQIESDANDKIVLKATTAVANNGSQVNWYVGSTWKASIYGGNDASSSSLLKFSTTADGDASPTERLRITSAGLVGIGTSSPNTRLEVASSISTVPAAEDFTTTVGYFNNTYDNGTNGTTAYTVLRLRRDGVTGVSYGNSVDFGLARYEAVGTNSRSRLDIRLGHGLTNTTDTTVMSLLSSGAVGIGTTGPSGQLDVETASDTYINFSTSNNGSAAGICLLGNNNNEFFGYANNLRFATVTGKNAAGFNERMRMDSSGRLLVGTSSTSADTRAIIQGRSSAGDSTGRLHISSGNDTPGDGDGIAELYFTSSGHVASGRIAAQRDGGTWTAGSSLPTRLTFSTTADGASSPTERMRIRNTGQVDVFGAANTGFYVRTAGAANSTDALIVGTYSATDTTNGTASFIVRPNGNVENTNNSYGAISDIKLKENIVDANSQWDDIKALRPVNYNFKEGQTHTQLGLIAQEVELVSLGLVSESSDRDEDGNDLGTVTKSVNYSVLYMKAVKALQEAMERIETLEAKVAALETK
jgi:hypothetical protein